MPGRRASTAALHARVGGAREQAGRRAGCIQRQAGSRPAQVVGRPVCRHLRRRAPPEGGGRKGKGARADRADEEGLQEEGGGRWKD
jgi:hypothetical protein